jgi:putative transmembrane protein PGPGW
LPIETQIRAGRERRFDKRSLAQSRGELLMRFIKHLLSRWHLDDIKVVRRVIVSVIGVTVLFIGIALLVLPGPAFVVIPAALAILATEYAWARRWLRRGRRIARDVVSGRKRAAIRDVSSST